MKHHGTARWMLSALTAGFLLAMVVPTPPASAVELPLDVLAGQVLGSDGIPQGRFGCAVDVWGDTAIVGKFGANAAHIFVRRNSTWVETQKLVPATGPADAGFGASVAIRGNTVLVGAPWDTEHGDLSGAAYVFTYEHGHWWEKAKLLPKDSDGYYVFDLFGSSVALSGNTALIGAYGDASDRGAAYVFTGSGSNWSEPTKVTDPSGASSDHFGSSVAVSGSTALIGAYGDDGNAGAAHVFTGSGSTWAHRKRLVAPDRVASDLFGYSVALSDDTALIGAPGEDDRGDAAGAAYVFTGSGDAWGYRHKLTSAGSAAGDDFGLSVALSGGTALVGAGWRSEARGAAYLFTGGGNAWTERHCFAAADGEPNDRLGTAVALSGGTAVVGAPDDDVDGVGYDAGSAWFLSFTHPLTPGIVRIAGANRYLTAVAASKRGFPAGAPAVVVATGTNWPDALGGSALAGAAHGPLLLTKKDTLPAEVTAEIRRLGAVKAYVLGSTAAVGSGVEGALVSMLGRANVVRLGGANRYETANKVASETIRLQSFRSEWTVYVTTGRNFPDATAASPAAAYYVSPVLLVDPGAPRITLPAGTSEAVILGSVAAVPASVETELVSRLGRAHVLRLGGANRYDTACRIASFAGVSPIIGLATGENFPDALTAGPMLARTGSVLVLARPTILPGETRSLLQDFSSLLKSMFIFGDTNAVSTAVEGQAKAAAGL